MKKPQARKSVEFLDNMKRKQDEAKRVNNRYAKTPEIQRAGNSGYKVIESGKKRTFETIEEEPNENRLSRDIDASMLRKALQSEVTVTSGKNVKRPSMGFKNHFNLQNPPQPVQQQNPVVKEQPKSNPIVKEQPKPNPVTQPKTEQGKRIFQSDKGNNQINHIIVRSTVKSQQRVVHKPALPKKQQQQGGLGVNMNELVLVRYDNGVPVYRYRKDLDPDFQPITN